MISKGIVYNTKGEILPNIQVEVQGSLPLQSTFTDAYGRFAMDLNVGDVLLLTDKAGQMSVYNFSIKQDTFKIIFEPAPIKTLPVESQCIENPVKQNSNWVLKGLAVFGLFKLVTSIGNVKKVTI